MSITVSICAIQPVPVGPDAFARQGYALLPALIEPALTEYFWSYVHSKFANLLLTSGDTQVPQYAAATAIRRSTGCSISAAAIGSGARLGAAPDLLLFPALQAWRRLERHRDRPACEISVTLNMGQVRRPSPGRSTSNGTPDLIGAAGARRRADLSRLRLLPLARALCGQPAGAGVPALRRPQRAARRPEVRQAQVADAAEAGRGG